MDMQFHRVYRLASKVDVESESNAIISENESEVHDTATSLSSHSSQCSSGRERTPLECDIGKLQASGVYIKGLCQDDKYRLLTTEPNPYLLSDPHTCPCPLSNLWRFKPAWLKHHPCMH